MTRPLAILPALAILAGFSATDAQAQFFARRTIAPRNVSMSASPAVSSGTTSYSSGYAGVAPARSYSYSYYTLSPLPPRTYVGYGSTDFPYHGQPYGHPYDPWTWPMMSGSYGNGLARYYDPPVK